VISATDLSENTGLIIYDQKCKILYSEKSTRADSIGFSMHSIEGMPAPLLLVTKYFQQMSGAGQSSSLLTLKGNKIRILVAKLPNVAVGLGGLYINYSEEAKASIMIVWQYDWNPDEGEAHYSDHRYILAVYKWDGNKFEKVSEHKSARKYGDRDDISLVPLAIDLLPFEFGLKPENIMPIWSGLAVPKFN
jgi:hypothetical protein